MDPVTQVLYCSRLALPVGKKKGCAMTSDQDEQSEGEMIVKLHDLVSGLTKGGWTDTGLSLVTFTKTRYKLLTILYFSTVNKFVPAGRLV